MSPRTGKNCCGAWPSRDRRPRLGQSSYPSIRPEGISLAVEECPVEENLNILTASLSALQLLKGMQRRDFPLWLHRHTARHLLVQVVLRINQRAAAGSITRLIKVWAHRAEPLNEQADLLAAEASESVDSRPVQLDLDPEAFNFLHKGTWVEWDARVLEDLVQRATTQCVQRLHAPFGAERNTQELRQARQLFPSLQLGCCGLIRAERH